MTLNPSSPWHYEKVLMAWAQAKLTDRPWKSALSTAHGVSAFLYQRVSYNQHFDAKFKVPRFAIYQALCGHLETANRIVEAAECFHEMKNEWTHVLQGREAKWVDGKWTCMQK